MKLFKSKWSKWKPVTIYNYEFVDFILLGRINSKNGDLQFKSIKVHGRKIYTQAYCLFNKPFDANEKLLELINENK